MDNKDEEYWANIKFVILNHVDRPCPRHIAQIMPDGETARYIHPSLRHWCPMGIEKQTTDIQLFGISQRIYLASRPPEVEFDISGKSEAKYSNGKKRPWQDATTYFTLPLWIPNRKDH